MLCASQTTACVMLIHLPVCGRRQAPANTSHLPTLFSHPQVISHLYELYGDEVASMLDGFFAFVILDKRTNTFYAARDPIGITCMYIGWGKDGSVWLSSEMKCLKVWGQSSLWGVSVLVVPLPHPAGSSQDDCTHSQQCPCLSSTPCVVQWRNAVQSKGQE